MDPFAQAILILLAGAPLTLPASWLANRFARR